MSTLYRYLRKQAAQKAEKSDCTVIALAVVAKMPYNKAHSILEQHGRPAGKSVHSDIWISAYKSAGLELKPIDLNNKTVGSVESELAQHYAGQKVLLHTRGHIAAWDGNVIQDWSRGSARRIQFAFLATRVIQE
jgi:hypothetical protein